jgi:hypothetical protein
MTHKQKRIIAILAIANVIVILTMVGLMAHPTGTSTSSSSPSPTLLPLQPTCQASPHPAAIEQATHLLAQAGLGGTVALDPTGSLNFEIVAPDRVERTASASETGSAVDDAAQSVWTALDIALALNDLVQKPATPCAAFTRIRVTVLVHSRQTDTQIEATVSISDLMAYDAGELSQNEFIERVAYDVNVIRDAQNTDRPHN